MGPPRREEVRRPRILLDVDGPLTRGYVVAVCDLLSTRGICKIPADATDWDVCKSFGVDDATRRWVHEEMKNFGVAEKFNPRHGAREFVDGLREWADVYACTAPLAGALTWAGERERWLKLYLDIPPKMIVQAEDKHLVAGDALVDDKPSNIVAWHEEWPARLAVMWSDTYNLTSPWRGKRAGDYATLKEILEEGLRR